VAALVIGSLGLHLLFLILSRTVMAGWSWAHEPVHAVAEVSGALIALTLVPLLLSLERRGDGTSHNRAIANALIGMGILDGMHACVPPGNTFVWLHSLATYVGGVLFLLVWARPGSRLSRLSPVGIAVGVLSIGGLSIAFENHVPQMLHHGRFTLAAEGLNFVGGLGLFAAAAGLVRSWRRHDNSDDLLFVVHCCLFGAAALMFEQSSLWDVAWWGWHVLRLLAYGVALWYVVAALRIEEELAGRALALEQANMELQHFAYVASHDLQEPLRTMASGFVERHGGRIWIEDNSGDTGGTRVCFTLPAMEEAA